MSETFKLHSLSEISAFEESLTTERKTGKGLNPRDDDGKEYEKWKQFLHLEETLGLEEKLVDLLVLVDYALLLAREMQFPIYEHSISIRDSRFSVFDVELVEVEDAADNAG
jgi:hypothetical protein